MSRRRDRRLMGRAMALACSHHGKTGDNPSVGCVVTDRNGNVIAEAVTGRGGRPHAEERALEQAGVRARGGSVYVTLEPCRLRSNGEPACSVRLLDSGVERVVIAVADAHPQGAGGIARLRGAGLKVEVGLKGDAARRLYRDFFRSANKGA
jgi:pyrimidine deaminase RibD-like protein